MWEKPYSLKSFEKWTDSEDIDSNVVNDCAWQLEHWTKALLWGALRVGRFSEFYLRMLDFFWQVEGDDIQRAFTEELASMTTEHLAYCLTVGDLADLPQSVRESLGIPEKIIQSPGKAVEVKLHVDRWMSRNFPFERADDGRLEFSFQTTAWTYSVKAEVGAKKFNSQFLVGLYDRHEFEAPLIEFMVPFP